MKRLSLFVSIVVFSIASYAQSSADSVTITFRANEPQGQNIYLPGQFNNWGPNSSGVISPGAASQMTYDATLALWTKTYTFKTHDASDTRRTLGDSVFQYKINKGGSSSGWNSDPMNPESNPNDNNNSILRLTKFFWFQLYLTSTEDNVTKITAGLVHANSDSITSILLSAGSSLASMTTTDITSSLDRTKRILNHVPGSPIPKTNYLRLVAYNNHGDSVIFQKEGYTILFAPLPGYAKHGVTLASPASGDSVTFRLLVPNKDVVLLRVAPVGQSPALATPIPMRKSPTSSDWWVNVKLPAGLPYEYLYEIEGGKKITDPFGRYVGTYGTRFSTGSEGLAADNFVWTDSTYERPPLNKLVIYEMNLGEFAGGYYGMSGGQATFDELKSLLGYLDSLGINAIELMPINDYGNVGKSGFSWGYDLNSYFAIEPAYGTPAQFKSFVDEAHKHGIAIILDVVFNHQNDTGPLWQMLPEEVANPYFKSNTDYRPNEDGLAFFKDMDHWTNETQELVFASIKMWIEEYKIDGFRYDYTQGVGWSTNEPTKGILGWANKVDSAYQGKIYQIAEHLPESPALIYYSGMTGGWHDSFRDEIFKDLIPAQKPSLFNLESLVIDLGAYGSNDNPSTPTSYANRTEPVNATVTHDEQSPIFEMTTFQGVGLTEALQRDKLYGVFAFTSLGIPMLWQGQELSAPRGWSNDNQKLVYRPVEWNLLPTARGQSHYEHYKMLIRHRKLNPALYNGTLVKQFRYDAERVLVWGFNDAASGTKVEIVANLSASQQTINNVPWLAAGNWYDIFDQSVLAAGSTTLPSFTLPGFTAKVFSNKTNNELGVTSVHRTNESVPAQFSLLQNYPNPFNPATTIKYQLPAAGYATLKVYDMLGRDVATLVDGQQSAGSYSTVFNASHLASGIYFYKLTAGNYTMVKRMSFVK